MVGVMVLVQIKLQLPKSKVMFANTKIKSVLMLFIDCYETF
jgi:hypothetical protein